MAARAGLVAATHEMRPSSVGPEVVVALAVGGRRARAGGVVEDGPQPVVLDAGHLRPRLGVHDQAGDDLALGGGAHPGLAVVQPEAFVAGDLGHLGLQPVGGARRPSAASPENTRSSA